MSSEFGNILKVSVFGQSHGKAIGVNIDGLPAGEPIDPEELNAFLDRRKPGKSPLSTARKESDTPVFLSGLETASPVAFLCAPSLKTTTSTPRITASLPTSPAPPTRTTPPG